MSTGIWNTFLSARGRGMHELDAAMHTATLHEVSVEYVLYCIAKIKEEASLDD